MKFTLGHTPYNKGKTLHYDVWNKGIPMPPRHTETHSEEAKEKMRQATKLRWARGDFKDRVMLYTEAKKQHNLAQRKTKPIQCIVCKKEFYASPSTLLRGRKFCSRECMGKGKRKEILQLKRVRGRIEDKTWRKAVFLRDDFTCQYCFERGCVLHAHHIRTWKAYPELRYEVSNGLTLCRECHYKVHRKKG